jgi:hypothetical protein
MEATVEVHAIVPTTLKRQAFSVMALRGLKFSPWVRDQLERLVAEQKAADFHTHQGAEGRDEA